MSKPLIKNHKLSVTKSLVIFTLLCVSACGTPTSTTDAQPSIVPSFEAKGMVFQGRFSTDKRVQAFLGIPFAQPPVGDLRWSAPIPIDPIFESNTVQATEFAPACYQGPHLANWYKDLINSFGGNSEDFPTPSFSEDCLYLNAWSPADVSSKDDKPLLPVFVFIHGGSNKGGWSYEPNYLGEQLARKGMVVVSLAYRVGALGFFSHPELDHSNFGLLDQIAGLTWIQENVSKLGGDPNNVTVAGESSGASNIGYLIASPLAKGLFHRAVHQSGGWAMYRTDEKSKDEKLGLELVASTLGTASESDIAADSDIVKLRRIDSETILANIQKVYKGHFFDPVIDGQSVTQTFANAAKKGELNQVDLLIGSNANESRMYLDADETIDSWLSDNLETQKLAVGAIQALLDENLSTIEQLDQLATSYNYTCPSMDFAHNLARTGVQTWFYHFTKQRDGALGENMGAYHGAELPYVFNTHDDWLPTSPDDQSLTKSLMEYWLNFAKTGNPNSSTLPNWLPYLHPGDPVQFLGVDIKSGAHPNERLCQLFKE